MKLKPFRRWNKGLYICVPLTDCRSPFLLFWFFLVGLVVIFGILSVLWIKGICCTERWGKHNIYALTKWFTSIVSFLYLYSMVLCTHIAHLLFSFVILNSVLNLESCSQFYTSTSCMSFYSSICIYHQFVKGNVSCMLKSKPWNLSPVSKWQFFQFLRYLF